LRFAYPIVTHGLGKALPKNEALLVPFFPDVLVSEPMKGEDTRENFGEALYGRIQELG